MTVEDKVLLQVHRGDTVDFRMGRVGPVFPDLDQGIREDPETRVLVSTTRSKGLRDAIIRQTLNLLSKTLRTFQITSSSERPTTRLLLLLGEEDVKRLREDGVSGVSNRD